MRVTPVILPLSKAPDPVEKVAGSISFQFILQNSFCFVNYKTNKDIAKFSNNNPRF